MKIKFSWGTGWMEMDAEHIIEKYQLRLYRKWAKLFAQYGTTEQHNEFLEMVSAYMDIAKDTPTRLKRYTTIYKVLKGLVA